MNRILRGVVVLVASGLALGCNTEPDEIIGGEPTSIIADPGVVFVARGDSQAVLVRLIDQQGMSLDGPITVSGASGPVAVSIDSQYRPVFGADGILQANTQNTEIRLFVRGDALGAQSLTISAGGITQALPVTVTPTAIAVTLSNATPSIAEPVTVTPEAGLTFSAGSQLVDAAGLAVAYTVGVAADGSSMTVVFLPGASGTSFQVTDVVPAYAPALTVTLPSTTTFATAATVGAGLTGTDAIATAPTLATLTTANTVGVVDVGTSFPGIVAEGDGARFYKLVVAEAGHYGFTITWGGGKDLGVFVYDETGAFADIAGDAGGLDDGEEHAAGDLEAGTYYVAAVYFNYGAQALPPYLQIDVAAE